MKRKIEVLILLLIGVFILFKRYEIYYFLQGKRYLRPDETLELEVRPRYEQIESSSILYLESDKATLLRLSGREVWSESAPSSNGDMGYVYHVKEQTIEQYEYSADSSKFLYKTVDVGYKGTSVDREGIKINLNGKRKYGVAEDHDYTITITNLSDSPVAFYASVENE